MMWFLLLLHSLVHFGPASSSDPKQGKIILRSLQNKDSPCKGHVEAYYGNEKGYVGDKYWNKTTEEVVCRSTHCGKPENGINDVYRPLNSKVWLNELQCQGNERSLWDCDGWPGPEVSFYKKPTVKMVTCSNKIKINLKPHKCEGAVQYTVQSTGQPNRTGYICSNGFGNEEADMLCENLGCGGVTEILRSEWIHLEDFQNVERMEINCSGIANVTHPWQCVQSASPSCKSPVLIRCKGHNRVQLKGEGSNVCSGQLEMEKDRNWKSIGPNRTISDKICQQMHCGASGNLTKNDQGYHLTCPDHVSVVLTNDRNSETKCYGRVRIKVNNSIKTACGTDWTSKNADMVCKELNCGKLKQQYSELPGDRVYLYSSLNERRLKILKDSLTRSLQLQKDFSKWSLGLSQRSCSADDMFSAISYKSLSQDTSGILDHVDCTGSESSLWHCRAKHHNNIRCSSVPYVVCSGSVNVKLVDGPGRCAGNLVVQHEDQWKTAISDKWEETFSAVLCKQLECGDSGKKSSKTLDKGISNFLTLSCKEGTQISDISECITDNKGTQGYDQVEITCEKHTVIFLEESKPCSGTVGIEYRDKTRWLSGSNQTWNQNVANMICQELHCGNASKFSSKPLKNQTSLLVESRTCSSSNKSLLQCGKTEHQESDYNQTLAHVDCEGNITVTLTHGCWGKVNISTASKQGYVSKDAWTEAMSVQLCKELACQDKTLPTHNWLEETILTFKSLHALRTASKLSQHTLVDANTKLRQKPAYVVCKGSIKPRFKPSRDKCSGNVEVFYEGSWIPVHKDALENIDNQNTICEELNCGKAVTRIDYSGPLEVNHLIRRLQCQKNTNSLATCQDVVVEKIEGTLQTNLAGLKCSEWSTMVLEVEHSCKGEVVVYSEGVNNQETKRSFVSSHGWREAEGERLCMDLKCGKYKLIENRIFSAEANSLWSQSFNCSSKPESIWQCEKKQTAISQENKLFLECEDEPEVVLSEKCTGKLTINGSPVCSSQWKTDYSHRVCQQLNCGNAIYFQQSGPPSTDSYHVDCDEHNYLIGQCKRVRGKCNSGFVSISCVGSVSFKTSEKCGGVLSIKYGKLPEEVCEPSISTELSNKLCQSLKCGPFEKIKGPSNQQTPKMQTSLACPSYYKDPRYCAKRESCPSPSIFTCKGYQPPTQPPPTQPPANPVPYIVGVLILLILVVLIVIFVRYQINRRNRKSMVPSDMEEADWDSGEYEDVDKDEMESFGRGRFRSESEVQGEKDMDSNRSYNYDDIDEVTEAQPLTPQGSMVRATEDEDMHEGNVKPNGVTYEVEDSQENYDDIDANPENAETTAEVHDGPKPAPEGDAAAPKDQIQKD